MTSSNPGGPTDPLQPPQVPQYPDGQQVPPYGSKQYYEQQPYGAYPPAPAVSGYGYQQASGTNGLAIASLVLSFFCSLAGLICGIIALNQIKRTGQGGRGLAIAGIVISALSIVIAIGLVAASGGNS